MAWTKPPMKYGSFDVCDLEAIQNPPLKETEALVKGRVKTPIVSAFHGNSSKRQFRRQL